ncbi:unnamed protein product [Calicophoron daubneyi]|uniref:Regulator of telomere elongation helicase 1 homolog n=1 Tax=Calicophoron daubneyi TaxID=300641 RepID=A0AAV2TDA5_CALDB
MPSVNIDGVTVDFPHQPYECQVEYMKKLLGAVREGKHAILESPTGTGKTLCLLCTSLAWLDTVSLAERDPRLAEPDATGINTGVNPISPKVIFASRTHSQLAQAAHVLKRTVYASRNISVIGSRDQLCLLPEIHALENNSAKIFACRVRVQTRTCDYFRNFDHKRDSLLNAVKAEGVVDIEDLVKFGKSTRCCPYYVSREMKSNADIIFMPYNYLLDPKIRRLYNIDLENAVVIFDEAHNIEQVCEDAASVNLTSSTLAAAIEYIRTVSEVVFSLTAQMDADGGHSLVADGFPDVHNLASYDISRAGEDKLSSLGLEKLLMLKGQLIELERLIDELKVTEEGVTKPSEYVFELFARAGLTSQTKDTALETIEEILSVSVATENPKLRRPKGISEVSEFIKTVFDSKGGKSVLSLESIRPDFSPCYKLFIKDEVVRPRGYGVEERVWDSHGKGNNLSTNRSLSYWCLSPGRAMQDLLKERVRCVILTSGTLYPVEPIQAELHMSFPVQLQNPHVIKPDQVRLAVITRGPDGGVLNSSYANREKPGLRTSMGLTLVELARIVPCGLLVFFPSYTVMNQCVEAWKSDQIYDRILRYKRIYVEPRDKLQFNKVFSDYRDAACSSANSDVTGAALFAVMRGRASEGLDLADFAGRGVAVLGLPYPPFYDPRVKLKMAYLDEQQAIMSSKTAKKSTEPDEFHIDPRCFPTGRKWYNSQAWRTVNQSIGRVIRHHRDYGAIFLCDERFAPSGARMQLPHWMQSSLRIYPEFGPAIKETLTFYTDAMKKYSGSGSAPSVPAAPIASRFESPAQKAAFLSQPSASLENVPWYIPQANEVDIFSKSLASDEAPSLLTDKSVLANYKAAESSSLSNKNATTSSSVFESIDSQPISTSKCAKSDDTDIPQDDTLADKLLRCRPSKRIRLDHADSLVPLGNNGEKQVNPSEYLQSVRSLLLSQSADEAQIRLGKLRIKEFRQALQAYRSATSDAPGGYDSNAVATLFLRLSQIFQPLHATEHIKGAACFIHPVDQLRYRELCSKLSQTAEASSDQSTCASNTEQLRNVGSHNPMNGEGMACSKCHLFPAQTPLVSLCKHIACFSCWRNIVEEGNHRCPVCQTLIRRRDLKRLVQKKEEAAVDT